MEYRSAPETATGACCHRPRPRRRDRCLLPEPCSDLCPSLFTANPWCLYSKFPIPDTLLHLKGIPGYTPTPTDSAPALKLLRGQTRGQSQSQSGILKAACRAPPPWACRQRRLTDLLTRSFHGLEIRLGKQALRFHELLKLTSLLCTAFSKS